MRPSTLRDWLDALVARRPSASASTAIEATSTAARAALPRPDPRACAAPAAAIARAPKAGSITAIVNEIAAGESFAMRLAWGITLPLHRPLLARSPRHSPQWAVQNPARLRILPPLCPWSCVLTFLSPHHRRPSPVARARCATALAVASLFPSLLDRRSKRAPARAPRKGGSV